MITFEAIANELLKDDIILESHNPDMEGPAIKWESYADSIGMDEYAPEMYVDFDGEGICITSIRNSHQHEYRDYESVEEMIIDLKKTMKLFYDDLI